MIQSDVDAAYDNMAHVPGSASLPAAWSAKATAFRFAHPKLIKELPYGPKPRQRMDVFHPEGAPVGLVVFVHGGYWMRLDKSFWSHLSEGALAHGWAVAIPSYTLTPEVRISHITAEIGIAIEAAASLVPGPVRLVGHSAGGHLVTRMICSSSPLGKTVAQRVAKVVSISGLHDLRPLLSARMNETLGLDLAEAVTESPVLLRPGNDAKVSAWYGAAELPSFAHQADALLRAWDGSDAQVAVRSCASANHFSILESFAGVEGEVLADLLDLTGSKPSYSVA